MEDFILCPQCNFENPLFSTQCENCGFSFNDQLQDKQDNWLDSLRQTGELIEPENVSEKSNDGNIDDNQSSDETPDWLKRIQNFQTSDEESKEIEPDVSLPDVVKEESVQENEKTEELDWLKEFRTISESEEESAAVELSSAESEESQPDDDSSTPLLSIDEIKQNWQKEFPNLNNNVEENEISPAEDLPDWLNKNISDILSSEEDDNIPNEVSENEESVTPEPSSSHKSNELPKWLTGSTKQSIDELNIDNDKEEQSIPVWLREINQKLDEGKSQQPEDETENIGDSELLFNKLEMYPESEKDGLIDEESQTLDIEEKEQESQSSPSALVFENDEIDQFSVKPFTTNSEDFEESYILSGYDSEGIDEESEDYELSDEEDREEKQLQSSPFSFDEIPDWLEKIDLNYTEGEIDGIERKTGEVISETDNTQEQDIQKANLPEWLKALRPIEVVTPKISNLKSQKRIESAGPLAGFKGVLSTEQVTKSYTTPPTYSVKIKLTDKQKIHAKLLDEIISPDISLGLKAPSKRVVFSTLPSLLIPLLFLTIVVITQFLNISNAKTSDYFPAETVRFHNLITGYLNQNQEAGNLLVINEVDASAYPEINLISGGIFENLFVNNHWITAISTNPNGVIVADNILSSAKEKVPSFNYSERVINLGYLPGNYLGIQSFLSNPQLTMPIDINKNNAWESSYLSNIDSINDFDLILLISDNSDNAKLWVEQVNLLAPEVGLLLISTTQSIPLMQPYVKSNQIDGMVGGLSGGLAFNLLANNDTNEISRYSSFVQIVAIFFIGLLVSGGLASFLKKIIPFSSKEKLK